MARYFKVTMDWDGSLTTQDTMFMMGKIAAHRDMRLSRSHDAEQQWKQFGSAYAVDYNKHQELYIPTEVGRRTPESEEVWLQSLRGVEDRSAQRVQTAGFFKGVKYEDVVSATKEALDSGSVTLRQDWHRLFVESAAARAGVPMLPNAHIYDLSILSVNWSETFIREVLMQSIDRLTVIDDNQRKNLKSLVEHMVIQANEIEGLSSPEGSTGALNRNNKLAVRTNLDKLSSYARSLDQVHVYIGDSATDLDCLLAADVGICVRNDPMSSEQERLDKTLNRVNVLVKHVLDIRHTVDDGVPAESKLWWARDFGEISSFLSRITVLRA
ncbi:hypothetical protein MRB53_042045 [Persea americana]|nr:hypothetical protein MRB53_042045 [Persea americana]